jgi:Xaa-Pro aminopeptidase
MKSPFNPEFFRQNRQELLKDSKCDIIIVIANAAVQRNGDSPYAFRQDSNFLYLCGVDKPDYVLVITKEESILVAPQLTTTQIIFDEQSSDVAVVGVGGVSRVVDHKTGWEFIKKQVLANKRIGIPFPQNLKSWGITPNPNQPGIIRKLKRIKPKLEIENILKPLAHLRMVKKPEELEAIQLAIDTTVSAYKQIARDIKKMKYEYEIEAKISYEFRKNGLSGHAFGPIVAGGHNATVLHYQSNQSKLQPGSLVVLDIGAEAHNYAADIARTIPYGKVTARQQDVIEAVADVQRKAIKRLKPGMKLDESEKLVVKDMGRELKKLGLITSVTEKNIRKYYSHAASHMLGLDAHDLADYSLPLAKDMVLTVEPGIYIPEENIGVRIEDDVLITENGCEILSKNLPAILS